jgi:hypothetical protein
VAAAPALFSSVALRFWYVIRSVLRTPIATPRRWQVGANRRMLYG